MTPIGLSGNGTLGYPISQPLFNGRVGPYEWSGALFIVACENATDVSNMNLVAFKSTDSGASWTRVDSLSNTIPNGAASVSYIGSGGVLDVGFMDDSLGNHGDLHRTTFDMATETFGSVEDVGITIPNYSGVQFLFQKSNGDFVYTWGEFSGGIRNVKFALKTLGSWSSATDISGATPRSRLFMDTFEMSTGDVGVLWFTQTVGNTTDQLFFATISGLTVSNALVPVTATDFIDLGTPSMYLAGPDTIVYPIISKASLADNEALYVMAETVSTSPSWSVVSVFSETATLDDFGQYPQIFEVSGGFEYYWTDLGPDFDITDGLILKSTASSLAGPWSAPETYYDANASPSDPPASSNEMFPFYGRVLGDGTIGLIMGEVQHVEGPSFCGVLYYLPPGGGPPTTQTLELTKIVIGGDAVPGDFGLSATGGSPESDISGDGHVGPTEVSPGTYELAETDHSGPTWGDATWDSSLWGGGYVPGNWDCGDAEMPTPTSVVVPEGGAVSCSITNTFQGPQPPNPPGPGEANPVGCFELLRMDVTLMPARHLPTRGSTR